MTGDERQDGMESAPAVLLAPEVAALLQKVEDFAGLLDPQEAAALRRLLKAGILDHDGVHDGSGQDSIGYQQEWYRAYLAARHAQDGDGRPSQDDGGSPYYPSWWSGRRS